MTASHRNTNSCKHIMENDSQYKQANKRSIPKGTKYKVGYGINKVHLEKAELGLGAGSRRDRHAWK